MNYALGGERIQKFVQTTTEVAAPCGLPDSLDLLNMEEEQVSKTVSSSKLRRWATWCGTLRLSHLIKQSFGVFLLLRVGLWKRLFVVWIKVQTVSPNNNGRSVNSSQI